MIIKKKMNLKILFSLIPFFLILLPHLIWLIENNYITITYAMHRTGAGDQSLLEHFSNPVIFLGKQIGIIIPFFAMFMLLISKFKNKFNLKDRKLLFLLSINIAPIILMFLTSLIMGIKIRTMWMTPFYLFFGVLLLYIFQSKINLKRLNLFFSVFIIIFIFSPLAYAYISLTEIDKRTDYPGKKIAQTVEKKWKDKFSNNIGLVGGDEWHGGNLSYHLSSRPKWDNILEKNNNVNFKNTKDGFVLIGEDDILNKICTGYYFKIEKQGVCMIGKKK